MTAPESYLTATTGAGVLDSYAGLIDSISRGAEGEGPDIVDVAVNGIGAVADTIDTAIDPLAALLNAGIGWLLEHIEWIREPLDKLLGNPDEINANTTQLKQAAAQIKQMAEQHRADLGSVADWQGEAADAYRKSMLQLAQELDDLGHATDGTAAVVGVSGNLVVLLRGIVFGLISSLISWLISKAIMAGAAALFTAGGSVAAFIGLAVVKATAVATKIAGKIAKLISGLVRNGERLAKLAGVMETLSKNLGRFSMVGGVGQMVYEGAKPMSMGGH
ncbi:WXG100 family type VII secretion target [Pseudonocardiaceae bacterium YIM PH 21723]|nr:WXG100 family type VII secretion target [Pseudonocardiaceae bacterium YIM PH 21723]